MEQRIADLNKRTHFRRGEVKKKHYLRLLYRAKSFKTVRNTNATRKLLTLK